MKNRDDFPKKVILELERRVNAHCSNPDRPVPTSGPTGTYAGSINIGVAAHICAASPGGPRYDPAMPSEERADIENGIWLCQSCAKMIDSDPATYTVPKLKLWRKGAENRANESLGLIPISKERYAVMEAAVLRTFPGKDIADPVGTMCDLTAEGLQRIDPRFRIAVAREGKTTTYSYEAIEPVSCQFTVKPEFANEFQDKFEAFVRHGEDLSIIADAVSLEGSPLFERFPQQGGAFKLSQAINRPASLIIELIDQNSGKNEFLAELPGRITNGKESFNFHGVVFGELLAIQLRAIPDEKTSVTVNINFEKWDGKDIKTLPYFDRMWAYFKHVEDGGLVSIRLEIEGITLTTFKGNFPPEATASICMLQYVRNARYVASALKRTVFFDSNAKISADHFEDVQDLYARLQVASPLDLARNASFTLSPIAGETERECMERIKSEVFGAVSFGLPIDDWTLFGQDMPAAVMEMTYSAARFNPLGIRGNGNVGFEIIADTESTIQSCLKLSEPVQR